MSGKSDRRNYVKTVGGLVAGLAIGGAAGYLAKGQAVVEKVVTETLEKTVTKTVTGPAPTPVPTPTPTEKVSITMEIESGCEAVGPLYWSPIFEEKTGINVKIDQVDWLEIYEKVMLEFMGHTGAYDSVYYYGNWLPDFYEFLVPIEEYIEKYGDQPLIDDCFEAFYDYQCVYQDMKYALLWDGDMQMMYRREDLFRDEDIRNDFEKSTGRELTNPNDYDELNEIAKFFHETDYIDYGIAIMLVRGLAYYAYLPRFAAYGGMWFEDDGTVNVNSEAGVKAMASMAESLKYAPPGSLTYTFDELLPAMHGGKVFFALCWIDMMKGHQAEGSAIAHPPPEGGPEETLAMCDPFPGGHAGMGAGMGIGINKDSKHPDETYQWNRFVCSPPQVTWSITNPSSGQDPFMVKEHFDNPEVHKAIDPYYLDVIRKHIPTSFPEIKVPHSFEFQDRLDLHIHKCLEGTETAEEAMKSVEDEWKGLIRKYWEQDKLPIEYVEDSRAVYQRK